ncbi:MAG: hypothetical protein RR865_11075 [Clostridia bacterium]
MITYSDYAALYPSGAGADEFDKWLPSASALLSAMTFDRAQAAVGIRAKRVLHATCALVNEMHLQQAARGEGGARVSAVSNDGYSESYGTLKTPAQEQESLRAVAGLWLSGTGLMSAL